jgi:hypothetical protein
MILYTKDVTQLCYILRVSKAGIIWRDALGAPLRTPLSPENTRLRSSLNVQVLYGASARGATCAPSTSIAMCAMCCSAGRSRATTAPALVQVYWDAVILVSIQLLQPRLKDARLLIACAVGVHVGAITASMAQGPNSDAKKTVAIVGGGVAGIASARFAKDEGMAPLIFEKGRTLGGLWGDTPTYSSLRTNITKFNMRFSDFPWPDDAPLYPTKEVFGAYLSAYFAANFPDGAAGVVQLGSEVTRVAPATGRDVGRWEVAWRAADGTLQLSIFDCVSPSTCTYACLAGQ